MLKKFLNGIFPKGSDRRLYAGKVGRKLKILGRKHPDDFYAEWFVRTEPLLWTEPRKLDYQPLISIIVPVYNAPDKYLLPMVYSVINQQAYDNWELILVNASSKHRSRQLTERCKEIDTRIKIVDIKENKGIAGNTDAGIAAAKGEYIALLDHDDELAPQALYEVANVLQTSPRPQFIYSDEDKISESGEFRFDPFFKPDWSPFLFRHVNYLNHFAVIEKKLIKQAGGYRQEFEGAQDYDLFLRLVDTNPIVKHIPKILYHWRIAIGSTAHNFNAKKNVRDAGMLALSDHLKRHGQNGEVGHLAKEPGFYSIAYQAPVSEKVALILAPTVRTDQYIKFINSILNHTTSKLKLEVFIADVGHNPAVHGTIGLKKIKENEPNAFVNKVMAETDADSLVLVNAAVRPLESDWLDRLIGLISQNQDIGVAAPLLVDKPSKTIFDAGLVRQGDKLMSLFQDLPIKSNTYFGR